MREIWQLCQPVWEAWACNRRIAQSPAAYWAGLADALPVIHARLPEFAEHYRDALERCGAEAPSLRAAAEARELLQTEGWCPGWREILQGARPAPPEHTGPGDWPHGWQFHASRTRNQHLRDSLMLPAMTPDARALVRSQSGPHAGSWLAAIPAEPATTLAPQAISWRSTAAYACRSRSATADADRHTAVGHKSTD